MILRRDIYDRSPRFTWGKGRVTLLGDAIHAMQPNMGQGGCMAIEDSYQLALELDRARVPSLLTGARVDFAASLKRYEESRRLRFTIVHGMARMAAVMASTYQAYLGPGLGPLSFLAVLKIPHPGTIAGRLLFNRTMGGMLDWVLGGYSSNLEGRPACCRLADKASEKLQTRLENNEALERAIDGEWLLFPLEDYPKSLQSIHLIKDDSGPNLPIGSAGIWFQDGSFHIINLENSSSTRVTRKEGKYHQLRPHDSPLQLRPFDNIQMDKVKYKVKVIRDPSSFLRIQQQLAL